MNSRKCKHFRRLARSAGKDMPERKITRNKKGTSLINEPKSVRGIYRQIKKWNKTNKYPTLIPSLKGA